MVAHRTKENMWAWRMSPAETAGPAVLIRQHGQGQVVCVPCALDAAFAGDYRMPEHRKLVRNLVRYLNPRPEVLVEAPSNVEIVITRDRARRRLLVHLICFSGPATSAAVAFPNGTRVLPTLMEHEATYRATVRVNRPLVKAELADGRSGLSVSGRTVELEVSNCHEVLIISVD